jgi:hypothetical protein
MIAVVTDELRYKLYVQFCERVGTEPMTFMMWSLVGQARR